MLVCGREIEAHRSAVQADDGSNVGRPTAGDDPCALDIMGVQVGVFFSLEHGPVGFCFVGSRIADIVVISLFQVTLSTRILVIALFLFFWRFVASVARPAELFRAPEFVVARGFATL